MHSNDNQVVLLTRFRKRWEKSEDNLSILCMLLLLAQEFIVIKI